MKRRVLWLNVALAVVLVAVLGAGYWLIFAQQTEASTGRTVAVQMGTVTESVTASGTVATAGRVELAFAGSGLITDVDVEVGQEVREGQRLVAMDDESAQQQVANAAKSVVDANNAGQQSSLQLAAARSAVKEAKADAKLNAEGYDLAVKQTKAALDAAMQQWSDACLDSAGTCPSASTWSSLRSAEEDVRSAQRTYDQKVAIAHQGEISANLAVNQANVSLVTEQANASATCTTYGSTSTQCSSANSTLLRAQQSYDSAVNSRTTTLMTNQQAVENAHAAITEANVGLRKLQADLMKSGSDAARNAQTAYDNAVLARKKGKEQDAQAITNAEEALAQASAAMGSVQVGDVTLNATQAQESAAQAGLDSALVTLDGTRLTSPIAGTVVAVNAEVGQVVAGGGSGPVVVVIPSGGYELQAEFSEADAIKISVGDKASVTFDALAGLTATGVVEEVDAMATESSNLITYGVRIAIDDAPQEVREGMTATVAVTVAEETDVLWAPSSAITRMAGQSTVTVRKDGVDTVTPVKVGLVGDRGTVVTSGVQAGDQLVINTAATGSGFPSVGMPGIPGSGGGSGLGRIR